MATGKYDLLLFELKKEASLLIAFSGGADSSLLLFAAAQALGRDKVLAVTAVDRAFPALEREEAAAFCRAYDFPHRLLSTDGAGTINARGNPFERCYYCKRELFRRMGDLARAEGYAAVAEGSNLDDERDYRPGRRALAELGILSPLKSAGFSKEEIRSASRELGLPSWDKPACACLVSRFPYQVEITSEALARVEKAEEFIQSIGFRLCRVRHYGDKARVEVEKTLVPEALRRTVQIRDYLVSLGYADVEIDPQGYRRGGMNVFA